MPESMPHPGGALRTPILVTGAAGFIGGAIARRFSEHGLQVAAMDLPGRSFAHLRGLNVPAFEGDVTSRADCDRILSEARPGAVVHSAALMGAQAPLSEYLRINAAGSETLAAAAAAAGARRFIYLSSVTVHGLPPLEEIDESAPLAPAGIPYAQSKVEAEARLRRLHDRRAIALTVLRPGDVYGPRAGEWVVKLVRSLRQRKMILVGGGEGLVNVTYVDNLADVVGGCLARDAASGRTYLVTDGAPVTWRRYLEALAAACGAPPPRLSIPAFAATPLVELMEAVLPRLGRRPPLGRLGLRILTAKTTYSIRRVREDLGWSPTVGFEEGMGRVAAWVGAGMPDAP